MKTRSPVQASLQILSPDLYHSDWQSFDSVKPLFQGISSSEETQLKPQVVQVLLFFSHLFLPPQHVWFMHVHQRSSSALLELFLFDPHKPLFLRLLCASPLPTCSNSSSTLMATAEGDPRNWLSCNGRKQHNELRNQAIPMKGNCSTSRYSPQRRRRREPH